jgi:hypothetical protein
LLLVTKTGHSKLELKMYQQVAPLLAGVCLLVSACTTGGIGNETDGATSLGPGSGGAVGTAGVDGNSNSGGTGGDGGSAGASATGGISGAGGADGAGDDGGVPGADIAAGQDGGPAPAIDYSIWQLQLPIGSGTSPTTVPPNQLAAFSNAYFYRADDGGQIFMDPATGVTTSGSVHPRTELREMSPAGAGAAWPSDAINTMTVTGKVLKGSNVTIAQVFNGPPSIPLAELQYSSGGFTLFYEEAKGQGRSTGLGNAVPLNTKYTFAMALSKGVLSVSINGKQVYTHTPSAGILASKFYFKVGNYDQTSTRGAVSTAAHSIVEAYSVVVVHQ